MHLIFKKNKMKRMLKKVTLLMVIITLCSYSCHRDEHRYIYVINNYDKAIYYGISFSYPDTSILTIQVVPGDNGNISHKIKSGEQKTIMAEVFSLKPTMQFFIFDADVIESTPWDSIAVHSMLLKRFQYTVSDMEKCNWTITYP
jgi:hypothetical protein